MSYSSVPSPPFRLLFTSLTNSFAGLNAGMKCSGISTATFLLIFLPIFAALFLPYLVAKYARSAAIQQTAAHQK